MPFAPSSFLLLVVRTGAPSSLFPSSEMHFQGSKGGPSQSAHRTEVAPFGREAITQYQVDGRFGDGRGEGSQWSDTVTDSNVKATTRGSDHFLGQVHRWN